ncbi:MAG: ABC transporter ATP-binding protein [Pseudonocardiaceae bacterium]
MDESPRNGIGGAAASAPVALSGVAVDVERVPVLRGLDLAVGVGESVGVVGPNGSGKSTLLRVVATLLSPVAGTGHVLGAELGTSGCARIRPAIALVEHVPALYPPLSLRENLLLTARLTGRAETAVDEVLRTVGLAGAGTRRADRCSQGMQRRAALARALLTDPLLLLLDEVHSGLDPAALGLVDLLLRRVRHRGGAAVVVSHDRHHLAAAADRVVEISDGRVHPVWDVRQVPA